MIRITINLLLFNLGTSYPIPSGPPVAGRSAPAPFSKCGLGSGYSLPLTTSVGRII